MARREAQRQRKAQWMIDRCYPHEVKTTDIRIEQMQSTSNMPKGMEPIVMESIIEPVEEVVMIQ